MLGRIFLNSRKHRCKDGVILWDVEELMLSTTNKYTLSSLKKICVDPYPINI